MIVKTDFTHPSGEGNAVFSKLGAFNNYQHILFIDRNFQSQRNKAKSALAEEFTGVNEYLPMVLQNAEERRKGEQDQLRNILLKNKGGGIQRSRSILKEVNARVM